MNINPGRVLTATAVGIAAVAAVIALAAPPVWVAVLVGLVIALVPLLSFSGATLPQWIARARAVSTPLTPQRVVVRDGAATVHHGSEVSAWLELSTPEPFAVTVVDPDGKVALPEISPEDLRPLMVQDDIVLTSMEFITLGQRSLGRGRVAAAISQAAGKTDWPVDGRSFIKLTLDKNRSYAAVVARAPQGDVTIGAAKAILAAAARTRIKCESLGYAARILSPEQVERVSGEAVLLSEGDPSWSGIDTENYRTEFFTVPVDSERSADWLSLPVSRVYTNMTLALDDGERPQVFETVGLVIPKHMSISDQVRGLPLKSLGGQHQQALSHVIPLAGDMPLSASTSEVAEARGVYAGGIGVLLGNTGKDRLFLRVHPGSGETMHCIGSSVIARWLVQRLAQQAVSINVKLADPAWEKLVEMVNSPLLRYMSAEPADIVVAEAGTARAGVVSSQTVIGVAETAPPLPAQVSIVQTGAGELTITTADNEWTVPWQLTASEKSALGLD